MDATTETITTEIQTLFPANSLQQGFIFHAVSHPLDDAYIVQTLSDYFHPIQIRAYQQAWNLTIKKYPALRMCFNWDELPIQIITKNGRLQFTFHDVSMDEDKNAAIAAIQQADRKLGFDLTQPTLLRLHLIKQSDHHYTLLKTEHHSIADAWSAAVLMHQVHTYYDQILKGIKPSVTQDIAYLQAQSFITNHQDTAQQYWNKIIDGSQQANDVNALFTHHANPEQLKHVKNPRETSAALDTAHFNRLKNLIQDEGLTMHSLLQFAWHKILHTYTLDSCTIVGTTLSGRTLPISDIDKSVGLYINTLPLIVEWDDASTIKQQLHAIHETINRLNIHCYVYLSALQRGGNRLFNSLLLFENLAFSANQTDADHKLVAANRRGIQKLDYPLALTIHTYNNSLRINFKYDGTYLTDERANQLLKLFTLILQQIPCRLHTNHNQIDLLTAEDYQKIITSWNATDTTYPDNQTLHCLFEKQALLTPNAIALVFEEQQLTYRELDDKANQLSQWLVIKGLHPSELVALCLDRSLEMQIAILGVLKAGCAYVPIDPEYPIERISYILKNTQTHFLLTQTRHATHFTSITTDIMQCIFLDKQPYREAPSTPLSLETRPSDLAYVIYTSGTTGQPKGVALTHRGVINRLDWMQRTYPLNSQDVVLQKTPYGFDVSVWELLWAHWIGAKIVMARPEGHKDPQYLQRLIQQHKVTVLHFVPSMLSAYTETLTILSMRVPDTLRYVFCSGEALLPQQVNAFYQLCNDRIAIHNLYGPTEASIDVTAFACHRGNKNVYIGRPIQNTRVYVLNHGLKPVPIGAIGDLYLGGVGLAREYWQKPDLTAKSFVPNIFATEDDLRKGYSRLYKTGDLARWLADGNLEYIGRADFQVKIRGLRIELNEIEQVMLSFPGILQAVALVKEQVTSDQTHRFIAAYYVGNSEDQALRLHLQKHLPDYMIPAALIALPSFPVTTNGKLNRAALPDPFLKQEATTIVAPRNTLERALCDIWQEVLHVERVQMTDNFFDLGGDSIRSIQLVSKMQKIGFYASTSDIFTHKTLLQLIAQVDHTVTNSASTIYAPFSLINENTRQTILQNYPNNVIEDIYPASYLQMGMLVESLKSTANGTYHDVFAYTIHCEFDESVLINLFQSLIVKYPLFRTAYLPHAEYGYLSIQHADLNIQSRYNGVKHDNIKNIIEVEKNDTLSIEKPGLFRIIVLNPTDKQFVLIFSFHHAIADGWSVASMMAELTAAYSAKIPIALEAVPSYQRVIEQERQALSSITHDTFWREYLVNAPTPIQKLVLDSNSITEPLEIGISLDPVKNNAILSIAKRLAISPDMIFLAAYFKTLSRLMNEDDVVIGLVMNNRLVETGGDKVFGLHLNTLPMRQAVRQTSTQLTLDIAAQRAKIENYKAYPYGKIRTDILQGMDAYTCAFNYMHFHVTHGEVNSRILSTTHIFEKTTISLTLHVSRQHDNFQIAIKALDGFSNRETAALMLDYIQHDIEAIMHAAQFSWLSPEHQQRIQDRKLPPVTQSISQQSRVAIQSPRNQFEKSLCDIWSQVLNVSHIGITDNFFQLGGDSIRSIRLVAMMQAIGFYVTVSDIFQHKTIFELIQKTNHTLPKSTSTNYIPFSLIDEITRHTILQSYPDMVIEDIYPAGYLQIGMLVESLKLNAEGTYHDVFAYTIHRPLDELALLNLFQILTEKHPLLRTAFLEHADYSYTCIQHQDINIASKYDGIRHDNINNVIQAEKNHALPLEKPGLFRIIVLNPTDKQFVLVFSFHHAITDGWSVASMMAEFTAAYCTKKTISMEMIPPYQRVIEQERSALASITHDAFWREYLASAPPPMRQLLFDKHSATEALEISISLNHSKTDAIISASNRLTVSPDMIFLAAYFKTVSRLTNQDDVVIGLVMNNRLEETGGEQVFGLHLNTLPLRHVVGQTSTQLTLDIAAQRARIESYKAYPYGKIRTDILQARDAYSCAFNYIHFHIIETEVDSHTLSAAQIFEKTTIPLTLHVSRYHDNFQIAIKTVDGFSDRETVSLMLNYILHDIDAIIHSAEFSWLSPEHPEHFRNQMLLLVTQPITQQPRVTMQAPRNQLEKSLCEIWKQVLNVSYIGITDDFFKLGGDSIRSIRLVARMQAIGFHVSVSDIFEHKTILELSERTNHTIPNAISSKYTPFSLIDENIRHTVLQHYPDNTIEDIYPAGYLQMGMLVESLKSKTDGTYHDVFAYTIHRSFNESAVLKLFQTLVVKHPLLRTGFIAHSDYGYICLQHTNLEITSHFDGIKNDRLETIIQAEKTRAFPIDQPGLFRIIVVNPTENQFLLVLSFHHAITDGWSVASLIAEFTEAYATDKPILVNMIPPYQRVIENEQRALRSLINEAFWREHLANVPPPAKQILLDSHTEAAEIGVSLADKKSHAILTTAKELSVSPDSLFLAAYFKTLSRFFNQVDVVIGLVMNTRLEESGGDEVFGLHLNTLPLRLSIKQTAKQLIRDITERRAHIEKFKYYPYGKIRTDILQAIDAYTCAFNYIHFHVTESEIDSDTFNTEQVFEKTTIPLTLHVLRHRDSFQIAIKALEGFSNRDTVSLMLTYIQHDIDAIIDAVEFSWLSPEHQDQLREKNLRFITQSISQPTNIAMQKPRNQLERSLCEIWQQVLNVPQIGINDDFFRLGGDSIRSIRVIAMMQVIGFHVSVSDIFQHKTILQLIERTNHTIPNSPSETYVPFSLIDQDTYHSVLRNYPDNTIADIYPAGYLQMGMLVESLKSKTEDTYHDVFAYTIHRPYNESAVLSIFKALAMKHPLLRTAFLEHPDFGYLSIEHKSIDIASHYAGIKHDKVQTIILAEKINTLALEIPGLFRILILNPTEEQFVLIFSFHHAITDGWSVASMIAEFTAAYAANKTITTDKIPLYQYVIAQERRALTSPSNEAFWRDYLVNSPLPVRQLAFDSRTEEVELGLSLTALKSHDILTIAKRLNVSPDSIFLTAYFKTLSRFVNQEDVVIGVVINNRLEEQGGDKVFGLHLNTLPMRLSVTQNGNQLILDVAAQRALIERVKSYPYGKIRTDILQARDAYTCAFNYIHFHVAESEIDSHILSTTQIFEKTTIPLTFHVLRHRDHFQIAIKSLDGFSNGETISLMLDYIQHDIDAIIHNAEFTWLSIEHQKYFRDRKLPLVIQPIPQQSSVALQEPRNQLEKSLCKLWQKILNVPRIGITDDFFQLGGDSIRSIRLVAMMQTIGFHVSVSDIFQHKSIMALIEKTNHVIPISSLSTYARFSLINEKSRQHILRNYPDNTIDDIYPAGYLQMSMLVESLKSNADGTNHDVFAYTIHRPLDEALLLQVFQTLSDKHPLLRTAFIEEADYEYVSVQFTNIDIISHYKAIKHDKIQTVILAERAHHLPIDMPGLFRIITLNPTENQFVLVFSFHHAITDGWSVASLMAEFIAAYAEKQPIVIESIPPYQRVIEQERQALTSLTHKTFWHDYLAEIPELIQQPLFSQHSPTEQVEISCLLYDAKNSTLLSTAKRLSVSPDMIFMAAYLKALAKFFNQKNVVIGLFMNNRLEEIGGDKIFGLHLNILPFRFEVANKHINDNDNFIMALSEERVRLLPHKIYPYTKLCIDLNKPAGFYSCAFNYTHFHINENNNQLIQSIYAFEKMSIPLTLQISRYNDKFRLIIRASNQFIDAKSAEALLKLIQDNI